jgi:thiol:disulfide interchange protein DsbD
MRLITIFLLLLSLPGLAQDAGDPLSSLAPVQASALGEPGKSDGLTEPEFLPVEEAYQLAMEIVDDRHLRLYWQIADGYYLYQKRFKFELQTENGPVGLQPEFPAGVVREDEYFGVSEVHYHFADVVVALDSPVESGTLKVTSQGCADAGLCYPPERQSFAIDFNTGTISLAGPAARPPDARRSGDTGVSEPKSQSLWFMLLFAFIGGSILNLMPCVFPVLSLKVFSFATGSEHTKHVHGWIYAAGVVTSFLIVASVLISLQQAGAAVGWGFQLQEPRFVALLAYLFFVMGLSLSGLIELGSGFMGLGSQLAERGGYSGSFFTGVLATIVASPCTAPFMGTALGFAVTQPPVVALSVFATLGAGMAAPMLLLSHSKTLRARMPRPGPWMETFKQLLAFPLYATAIWLLWVSGRQTSVTSMALLLCGMLALAMGLWLMRYRPWGRLAGVATVVAALALIPSPALENGGGRGASSADAGSSTWSDVQLQSLLAEGTPVFVNVTADWCITCIANERGTLSSDRVEAAIGAMSMEYLVVDWTDYDPNIAAFLARFNRNGVPLYLVYSGKPGASPEVLPQLLTPGIVIAALERAQADSARLSTAER